MGSDSHVPVPQSMKAVLFDGHPSREGWETTMTWWYASSFVLLVAVLGYAPETEISVWAKQEAAARLHLKETGAVTEFEFGKHYQDLVEEQVSAGWDKFSVKSMRMTDEDDDDEDDDDEEEEEEDDNDE